MGHKKRNSFQLNWQSTSPAPFSPNTPLSGAVSGSMTGTSTVYSNIQDVSNFDNAGIEVTWTGTPTGTISIMGSEGGTNFYALTFNPALTQPAGGAGGYLINLNQYPFRYVMIQYTNSSGSGSISAWIGSKDLN